MRKHPNSHREATATAPVLDSTRLPILYTNYENALAHDRGYGPPEDVIPVNKKSRFSG